MKEKLKHLSRFLLLFCCLTISSNKMSAQNPFDDLFKGFDFDAFLKDMEKAYDEDADSKTFGPASKMGAPNAKERTITTQIPDQKPQTIEESFLTPITQTIQEKGKSPKTVLSPESRNAFKEVMHEFITLLNSVTTKIEDSRIFSMPFKEQFLPYRDAIDKIAIAYGTMVSKKMYASIMPFKKTPDSKETSRSSQTKPPQTQALSNLRQSILKAIKELREIDKDLNAALADEEKEADEQVLKELSRRPRTHPIQNGSSKSIKKKRRGPKHTPTPKRAPIKPVIKPLPAEAL